MTMPARTRFPQTLSAASILLFCSLAFWGRFLFTGNIPLLRDLFYHHIPRKIFYKNVISQGALPLWTSNTGCGQAFLAEIESAVLYPFSILFLSFQLPTALNLSVIFHIFLSAFGVYLLMRLWKASQSAALLSAVSLAFSTTWIIRVELFPALSSCAWYPLILATFVFWLDHRKLWIIPVLACLLSLQLLAGWPEASLFSAFSLFLMAFLAGIDNWKTNRTAIAALNPLAVVASSGLIAILLSMAQILPTWEVLQLSERGGGISSNVEISSVPPLTILSLWFPSAYGMPGYAGRYWSPSNSEYWETAFYIGITPITILMAVAIFWWCDLLPSTKREQFSNGQRIRTKFLIALFVIMFLYSTGKYTPFFGLLSSVLPFLQWFRYPCKFLIVASFALSCLAGIGLETLLQSKIPGTTRTTFWQQFLSRWSILLLAGFLGCFTIVSSLTNWNLHRSILEVIFNQASVPASMQHRIDWNSIIYDAVKLPLIMGLTGVLIHLIFTKQNSKRWLASCLVALTFLDLSLTSSSLIPTGSSEILNPHDAILEELRTRNSTSRFFEASYTHQQIFYGESDPRIFQQARDTMASGWALVDNTFCIVPKMNFHSSRIENLILPIVRRTSSSEVGKRLFAMLNCDRAISLPPPAQWLLNQKVGRPDIRVIEGTLPRAFVVGAVKLVSPAEDIFKRTHEILDDPLSIAVTDQPNALEEDFAGLTPGKVNFELNSLNYLPNEINIEFDCEKDGVLVITESEYPGWQATVNGTHANIWRVNAAFQGIRLHAGKNIVRLVYNPSTFRIGCYVSSIFLSLCILFLLFHLIRSQHRRHSIDRQPHS